MEKIVLSRSLGTHDGTFHADEVTACALLRFFDLIDKDKIIRTRDVERLDKCEFVCDVGGIYDPQKKRFDHHQVDYKGPLSSAGMILEYLKSSHALSPHDYDFLNNALVRGVDAHDNGKDSQSPGVCTFSHIISNFTPIHYDETSDVQDAAFMVALDFAYGHIKRLWERFKYNQSSSEIVAHAMTEYRDCLIFNEPIPWMDTFFEQDGEHHPARFVIMPSGEKHWKLRGIPPTGDEKMKVRMPLPEEWAGLLDKELKRISGIQGALFCHKGRFISVWETKQDALQALEKVLSLAKQKTSL
ncbi:MAG: hypothetical protein JWO53_528 [Chlamydiia bacterium]|nr:hypothetical protein [Chlamydiia bacterium]